MKIRLMINKPEKLALIAQLEFLKMFERALRRAKLPVALTQGFNTRYKISYLSALPVGESSAGEPVEIDFSTDITVAEVLDKLGSTLPDGFLISRACVLGDKAKSLTTMEQKLDYRMELLLMQDADCAKIEETALRIIAAESFVRSFERKQGVRSFDLAKLISDFRVMAKTEKSMVIEFSICNAGSIMLKPREFIENLRQEALLEAPVEIIAVHRKATTFRNEAGEYVDAMSLC